MEGRKTFVQLMRHRARRSGEWLVAGVCIVEGIFPIVSHMLADALPAVHLMSVCFLLAGIFFLLISALQGNLVHHCSRQFLLYILFNAVITVGLYVAIFIGTRESSGINTALLLKVEMPVTFLFAWFFLKERLQALQLLGALAVFAGTLLVLWNGSMRLMRGDVLIMLAILPMPVANYCARMALQQLPATFVLMVRFLSAGALLLPVWYLQPLSGLPTLFWLSAFGLGILYFGIEKWLWYAGLRLLPLGRAIYIISAAPAVSLLAAYLLLNETPSVLQWLGFLCSMVGLLLLARQPRIIEDA